MIELNQLFDVSYGNKFDLNKMKQNDNSDINFVSRTAKNNGVTAKVSIYEGIEPYPAGLITVALGGSILSSFLQTQKFYTAQNLAVLKPLIKMTTSQLLFYCNCIESNRFRYSAFGREANVSLPFILIPTLNEIPEWVNEFSIKDFGIDILSKVNLANIGNSYSAKNAEVPLYELFIPSNGISSSGVKIKKEKVNENWIPFIRPSYKQLTSITGYINKNLIDAEKIFPAETLYVSTNGQGSHTYAYVSAFEFIPNSDVTALIPKREMSLQEKLFYAQCITNNRYKFSYGRKPKGDRLNAILLPEFPPEYVMTYNMDTVVNSFNEVLNDL